MNRSTTRNVGKIAVAQLALSALGAGLALASEVICFLYLCDQMKNGSSPSPTSPTPINNNFTSSPTFGFNVSATPSTATPSAVTPTPSASHRSISDYHPSWQAATAGAVGATLIHFVGGLFARKGLYDKAESDSTAFNEKASLLGSRV